MQLNNKKHRGRSSNWRLWHKKSRIMVKGFLSHLLDFGKTLMKVLTSLLIYNLLWYFKVYLQFTWKVYLDIFSFFWISFLIIENLRHSFSLIYFHEHFEMTSTDIFLEKYLVCKRSLKPFFLFLWKAMNWFFEMC